MQQARQREYVEWFSRTSDSEHLSALIGRFSREMGYDHFGCALVMPMPQSPARVVLFNEATEASMQVHEADHPIAEDPLIRLAQTQTLPIYWGRLDEHARFLQKDTLELMEKVACSGLHHGVSFPLHGAEGENGILSFITHTAVDSTLVLESSPLLFWMSHNIFAAAIRVARRNLLPGAAVEGPNEGHTPYRVIRTDRLH